MSIDRVTLVPCQMPNEHALTRLAEPRLRTPKPTELDPLRALAGPLFERPSRAEQFQDVFESGSRGDLNRT